jgi:ABC-type bacteriocin/lantibiotic exporter with double-glycine peptidase domain
MTRKVISSPAGAARKLFGLLHLDRKDVSAIYAFAIFAGLVQLSLPLGIQTIISFVMAGSVSTSIIVLIILVVVGVFLNGLLQVRQLQIIEKIKQKIFARYSMEFAHRLPRLNIARLDNYYLPERVNRFFDTMSLQKGMEKILLDIPAAIIQIFFGVILLSFYHPVFIAFGASLLLILYIILRYTLPNGFSASMEASEYKFKTAAWLEELARVIKTFKYSRGTSLNTQKADELVTGYLTVRTRYFRILLTQFWSLIGFKVIITAAMLILGVILLADQQINIGQFIAADIVILSVIGSVEKLILTLDKVYETLTSLEKMGSITDAETETGGTQLLPDTNTGVSISFKNLAFAYTGTHTVLQNINFEIKPGEKLCIMGDSGSGKSSALRLLTGAYRNYEGAILIDNIPLLNYELASLRAQTGILVSQQDIFQGTLRDNITMGNNDIPLTDLVKMIALCGLSGFLESLPDGFDTVLDPAGQRLSTRIKQGILLSRALLGKRRLLLLEEPFVAIDTQVRKQVLQLLMADQSTTAIITSMNPEVAKICDKVLVLKNGTVNAFGTWQEIEQINA